MKKVLLLTFLLSIFMVGSSYGQIVTLFHETFDDLTTENVLTNPFEDGLTDEEGYQYIAGAAASCTENGALSMIGGVRFATKNLDLSGAVILSVKYKTTSAAEKRFQIAIDVNGTSGVSGILNGTDTALPTEFTTAEFKITSGTASSYIHFRTEGDCSIIIDEIKIYRDLSNQSVYTGPYPKEVRVAQDTIGYYNWLSFTGASYYSRGDCNSTTDNYPNLYGTGRIVNFNVNGCDTVVFQAQGNSDLLRTLVVLVDNVVVFTSEPMPSGCNTVKVPIDKEGDVKVSVRTQADKSVYLVYATFIAKEAEAPGYTVTLDAGSGSLAGGQESELTGTTVTLPTATPSTDCAAQDWTFAGWSLTSTGITADDIIEAGEYTPEGDVTLHAVYQKESESTTPGAKSYKLVTQSDGITAGDYLFVAYNDHNNYKSYQALGYQNTNNRPGMSVTITEGIITTTAATASSNTTSPYEITLVKDGDNWALYDKVNETNLGPGTGTNNNLKANSPSRFTAEITATNRANFVCVVGENTHASSRNYLAYNAGTNNLFACYQESTATGYPDINLYKAMKSVTIEYSANPDCSAALPVVTVGVNDELYGSASYSEGIITYSANTGYRYKDYTIAPEENATLTAVEGQDAFDVLATGDVTITINFEAIPPVITVNATDGGSANYDEETGIITYSADAHYEFSSYDITPPANAILTKVTDEDAYEVVATGDVTITFEFTPITYTVNLIAESGTIDGSASFTGSILTPIGIPTATPSEPCALLGWNFFGWSGVNTNITLLDVFGATPEYYPTADTVFYAVYHYMTEEDEELSTNPTCDLPGIDGRTPSVSATNVALDATVSVFFTQAISSTDMSGITITPNPGNVVPAIVEENKVLAIAHDAFAYDTQYTVNIPAGTFDTYLDEISWSFTTRGVGKATNLYYNNLSCSGFTATWTGVEEADSYTITLLKGATVITEEDNLTDTSYEFSELDEATEYTFVVKAFVGEAYSTATSQLISTTTCYTGTLISWRGALDSDWSKTENWAEGMVPEAGHDVLISADNTPFPILTSEATVNDITIEPGAQLGNQHLLTYNKAYVGLSFADGNLSAGEWHMLAMPINDVYTGDLSFGGYPYTYLHKFAIYDSGDVTYADWTNQFQSNKEGLPIGEGFMFKVEPEGTEFGSVYSGSGVDKLISADSREYGFAKVNNTIKLPYFEDAETTKAHRVHAYNAKDSVSTIYYYNEKSLVADPAPEKIQRSWQSFKLAGQVVSRNVEFADEENLGGNFAMVANPFISAIDMDALYAENNSEGAENFKSTYQIWTGDGFSGYSPDGEFGVEGLSQYIAPFQSFLIEKGENYSAPFNAIFDAEKIGAADAETQPVLKSSASQDNKLTIRAINPEATVSTFIAQREGGDALLNNRDARKVLTAASLVPEIYTMKESANGLIGVGANIVGSDEMLIPLALYSTYKGTITLSFEGMASYAANIYLVDAMNKEIDLTGMSSYDYSFSYSGSESATGNRFYIRLAPQDVTNIDDIAAGTAYVYTEGGYINVVASQLEGVYVYNQQGQLVYEANGLSGATTHTTPQMRSGDVYMVRILTGAGIKTEKVIVK